MNAADCLTNYGEGTAEVCRRLAEYGWDPTVGGGWFSALAAVMAGFVFSAIVFVLTPQSPLRQAGRSTLEPSHSLPVFLGSFFALLASSFLFTLVSSHFHPLKVLPAVSIASAVFAAGSVQTFVGMAWLETGSAWTSSINGCFSLATRFVMLCTGMHALASVTKAQWIVSGHGIGPLRLLVSIALLGGPWVVTRIVHRPGALVVRWNGRLQVVSFKLTVAFVLVASGGIMFAVDRGNVAPAAAYPDWLAFGTLLGVGLIYALHEVNLPSVGSRSGMGEDAADLEEDAHAAVTEIHQSPVRQAMAAAR